ncbi:hypothetical protein AURANDRAFT_66204 [Aureococcus anophagefferens]|uniref:PHD-type domain-containing protein n=1 Tax=Aureococcus anophagefferens TaxID=44056 RepID=F0YGR0_AURAN|nr:hypothetical protein AURANDRAFT_66204 [Aureococcus anophagefferens]EGB05719.1 hypothetical protein AURANDRAFT_66204 [Aureococcus anophagefferens]|eukprot:XP_009039558.1 hypothetical protein AURANDRAFT_66204 [Aureococcus anophagefferens]
MACVALRDSVRALAKSCAAGGVHVPGAVVAMRELVHARAESAAAAAARDKADALALEEARALPQADAAEFPNFAAVSVAAVPLVVAGRRDDGGSATVLSSRVVAGAGVVYDVQYAVGGRVGRDVGESRLVLDVENARRPRRGAAAPGGTERSLGAAPSEPSATDRAIAAETALRTKTRELERVRRERDSLAEAEKEESARLALAHERRRAALRDASRARGDAVRTEAGAAALAETSYTSGVLAGAEERDADALAVRDQAARDRAHDRAALEADVARAREVAVEAERGREREQTKRERAEGCADAERVVSETALAERDALMQRSLSGIVDFLMPSGDGGALTKIRSFDALLTSPSALDDTSRRQADYIRAAMRCFDGLADLLSGGDAERLEVVFGAFDASMAKRRRVRGASERVLVALKDNIATAWQNHTQVGDYTAATQVLSLAIVPRMRDFGWRDQIRAFVSRVVPVTTGSDVLVLQFPQGVRRGDYWRRGVCVAVSEVGCFDVRPLPTTGSGRLICFVEDRVPADRVRHADSLICTKHDVQTAANLAMDRFPGARRDVISRSGWTRIGIERAALTAAFLRDPSVVVQADGGASTARRKTKWFLKEGVPRLLKRLNRRLADAGLRRSSEAHFRGLLAGPGYAKLTAELCTCVKCRDLGFVVYDLLRSVVAACSFSISVSIQERLYNQIDAEERFRSGEFRSHLKEESHVAQHCLCYLLSSENEPCFREPCVHGRKDGSTLSPPKTMEEIVAPRRLTRRDHEDECMVCYGDEGSLLCCAYCARAAHKECIRRHHNDLGGSSDSWTCWDCVRERSLEQHDGSCAACDGHAFLMGDLRSLAAVADAKIRDGVASGDLDGATVLEENGDASIVGVWARSVVAKSDVDLRAYHGHIAQDVCTTPYQKFVTSTLKDHEYTTIYDYWAKQSAKLHMEGTCEGQGNKGVSCSGRAFTCNNPTSATRAQYPDVPWAIFPSSPDQGGPAYLRTFRRSWSDSSRQDSFDTAVTLFAEEGEYRKAHPWLTTNAGDMSDGASNFRSTPAALYNMQSPYPTYKATSVSGHGKDVVDADNGVEQPKLRAAVDAGSDLTCASQYVAACDARRHTGVVNMRVEIDRSLDLTAEEKKRRKSIVGIGDAHFYACPYGGDLRTWEVFSRRLSIEAGRLVGIGPGRVVSRALLVSDHLLDRHALDVASAALTYPGESALPTDQQLLVNPAPFLSPDQKKTAAVAKEAAVEARDAAREERAVARRAPLVATFRNLRPHACPNCLAKFSSPARLRSHRLRGCGSSAAGRAERRLAHDATTIDALLAKSDGDLADALEARAELGLDLVTATFAEGALGFTCEEQLDAAGAPSLFRELAWALPSIPRHLVRGALVRVEAHRFGPAARDEVGMGWRSAFYYGTVQSRNGDIISVLYSGHASGQEHESHFSHVEIGTRPPSSGDVDDQTLQTSHEPAVVASVEPLGAAAAALDQVGFEVVDVGGTAAPTYSRAKELLEHAARPISAVETRMLNIWKKTKKEARDAAQNSAARDVARAARAAGVAAVDDDEVPSSDDDADDPMEMDTSPDGDANADGGADGGADAANDDPTDGYMAQLAGVGVRELRRRLREERGDSTPLASVRAADLAPSDLRTGESKAQATLDLLRQRLATVLAGGSP